MNLNDSVIVVTGSAGGMGLALTRALIQRGARVIAIYLREPQEQVDGAEFVLNDVVC